jgi:REP element-mobilizing transposase RayT
MPLIELTKSYDMVYDWFTILKLKSIDIIGYVIMPNHLHCIMHFKEKLFSVNKVISNGKRFMAYEIIKRLEKENNIEVLTILKSALTKRDIKKGQLHKVFKDSFDAKPIFSDKFMEQKLNYTHYNPVSGKWQLVINYTDYDHSSASFYELGIVKYFTPVHYKEL